MAENKHTIDDLKAYQALSLDSKLLMTIQRINAWYDYWDGDVYVSFSGGKDSTVLADIVLNECGLKCERYLMNCHKRIDDLEKTIMELGVIIGHDKKFIREQIG